MSLQEFWKFFALHPTGAITTHGRRSTYLALVSIGAVATLAGLLYRFWSSRNRRKAGDECPFCGSRMLIAGGNSRMRTSNSTSSVAHDGIRPSSVSVQQPTHTQLIFMGNECLLEAIRDWERAITVGEHRDLAEKDLLTSLQAALDHAYALQSEVAKLSSRYLPGDNLSLAPSVAPDFVSALGGGQTEPSTSRHAYRTMSILSDDSFVSALDDLIPSFDDLEYALQEPYTIEAEKLTLYNEAIVLARVGGIPVRVIRSEALHCDTDEEFLAKLHCIRAACEFILRDNTKRAWIVDKGRALLGDLMKRAHKDPTAFYSAFDKLINFVAERDTWEPIEEELRGRKVPMFTFYDVVLDFILLDAFDDLARPPSSVLAVAQNRFLSASF